MGGWGASSRGWLSASGGGGGQIPHRILQDMVNERAVRILLECILVYSIILSKNYFKMSHEGKYNLFQLIFESILTSFGDDVRQEYLASYETYQLQLYTKYSMKEP